MKKTCWFGLLAGIAGFMTTGTAAEWSPAENREGLLSSTSLAPFGVSLGYRDMERGVDPAGWDGGERLQNRAYVGELSVRLQPWLELFATAGSVETRGPLGDYGDGSALYSGGARLRIWHSDIEDPELLAGRYTLTGSAEYLHSEFDFGEDLTGDYQELTASLRLGWEIFVEKIDSADRTPYSLLLAVGPVYSDIQGQFDGDRGDDFESDQPFGVEAGVELYLHHKLSAAFTYLLFDEGSYRFDVRWRF